MKSHDVIRESVATDRLPGHVWGVARSRESPSATSASRSGGTNLYQYVGNNPASYTDPFGLTPYCPPCVAAAAAALAGAAVDVGIQVGVNAATDRPLGEGLGTAAATGAAAGLAGFGVGRLVGKIATGTRTAARARAVDPNRLNHIFGNPAHNVESLARTFDSDRKAFVAVDNAVQKAIKADDLSGVFETTVRVGGEEVIVRGKVIDGTARIGTFFIR